MEQLQPRLAKELSSLRKGKGLTPLKLQEKPTIRMVAARVASTTVDNLTDNQVYSFLLSELSRLTDNTATTALKNALGVDSRHGNLSARRLELAAKLTKHPDTIERYENQGITNFSAHLTEHSLHLQDTSPLPSLYIQELEAQAKATRAMTVVGLTNHLSLANHGEDLMSYLESPRKPYIDASVHITLLPSSRGNQWYRLHQSCSFQGSRESFRIAVVLNNNDGEQLMASGLVDDYHQLYNPDNLRRDIKAIAANSTFIIRNLQTHTQKLLRFRELEPEETSRVLQSVSEPLAGACWLLEVIVPPKWQTEVCSYEYQNTIHLQVGCCAYWYAPTLMYLKKLTFEFSRFPEKHTRTFFLQHFLGHAPGTVFAEEHRYTLHLNNWVMPGHGIVLVWQNSKHST